MSDRIISMLKARDGYVSGEELSVSLGITRAGIWKKIEILRQKGYTINAVPSKGYRLLASPDVPFREEIEATVRGNMIGREVIFYDMTTSTNEKAMELGRMRRPVPASPHGQVAKKTGGALEGTVIIADMQERGKGRFGRPWISPPGVNLYFTVLLEPPSSVHEASLITLIAATSVATAIRERCGLPASIKWPNDILINDKKVSGILTEMKSDTGMVDFVAVGIGVNVNMPLSVLPAHVKRTATSLKESKGRTVNRVMLLGAILRAMETRYRALLEGRKRALLKEWLNMNCTIGKNVSVQTPHTVLTGIADGIGSDGELLLRLPSGGRKKIYAGEVTILKGG